MSTENYCRSIGTQTEESAANSHGKSGGFRSEMEEGTGSRGESGGSEKFQSEMEEETGSLGESGGFFKKLYRANIFELVLLKAAEINDNCVLNISKFNDAPSIFNQVN